MTPELASKILLRFEGGEGTTDIWLDPNWNVSREEIQSVLRAELARRQERIEELERELKEANNFISMGSEASHDG